MPFRASRQMKKALYEKQDLELNDCQLEQLRSIEHQHRITNSLLGFIDSMATAFGYLEQARGSLEVDRICSSSDVAAMEEMLLNTFSDAHDKISQLVEGVRPQLETCRDTVVACVADLHEAERAASKVKTKVKSLEVSVKKQSSEQKIQAMKGKLGPTMHSARVTRTRALDSLRGCSSRQRDLCHLTSTFMEGTSAAILLAIRPLTTKHTLPPSSTRLALADIPGGEDPSDLKLAPAGGAEKDIYVADVETASASTGVCVADMESKESDCETCSKPEAHDSARNPFAQTIIEDESW